jgi:hypothetical protein
LLGRREIPSSLVAWIAVMPREEAREIDQYLGDKEGFV